MTCLLKMLIASAPMTLSGVPAGFQPWLLADIARAAPSRTLFVAPDEQLMRAVADTAHYFAPEIEIVEIPAWDCPPYDRSSTSLRTAAARPAGHYAQQGRPRGPQPAPTHLTSPNKRQ